MPVLMMVEIPGADAAFAEGMRHAGVLDELQTAQGFRGHWSGAANSGYRAIELWDSREDCQKFAEANFAPKLPPGAELPPMETKHERAGPTRADARNRVSKRASLVCCLSRLGRPASFQR
jgi:hypothetical protein